MATFLDIRDTKADSERVLTVVDLVIAAQADDRSALEALFDRYQNYVIAQAMRYVDNWDDASEVSQEVFILVIRRLHQLQVPAAFSSWLRRITHRTAINFCRRRRMVWSVEPESLDANAGRDVDPFDHVLDSERCEQVRDGLQRLKSSDRKTLEAFYLQDHSLLEMAERFNAPLGTIKRRLHVARKRLAKELEVLQAI